MKKKKRFTTVKSRPSFPEMEKKVLDFWKKNKIFEKSVDQREKNNPYTFYDGPPFVTGYPHYGHLIGSIAKDVIPRFFTMKGKRVRRVWGWDCHGLPIENKVEEKLGLKNRQQIENFGINKFIKQCQQYVEKISSEWEWYVDRIGRWVDMKKAYRTMDLDYMESVIWVFKQLYDKGLIYKGVRTSLYCTRCGTPVSNFEIAMDNSYTLMEDPAITVKFKLKNNSLKINRLGKKDIYLLAWTTTPWTLPSNRALVVDKKEDYLIIKLKEKKEYFVLAEKRSKEVLEDFQHQVIKKIKGRDLIGLKYTPPYTYFPPNKKDFKVYSYPGMVNMEEGTGIVHSAPGFGEIDTQMGKDLGLTLMLAVNNEGKFIPKVKKWAGIYVKKADPLIIEDLKKEKYLFKKETISHRYPYCYRCQTPLIHRAQESWFIDVQGLRKKLLKTNRKINWVPNHFKYGRFQKGIEQAPDWCISRTRYWATIMPIWKCQQCGVKKVVGSVAEIEELSGKKVVDLHRSGVDHLTFPCSQCGGSMKRISEVLDCWMESGSMPYGERHYPFENKKDLERSFPADYIVEYTGQVRAWFYVMHVISNALMNSHCFKNVVVTGVMTGTDGRKMSKSYGNYPDPKKILEKYGGDALRLYLLGSSVMLGKKIRMTKGEEIEDQVKRVLLILWNSYRYFLTYFNFHQLDVNQIAKIDLKKIKNKQIMDRWIIARLHQLIDKLEGYLDDYHIPQAVNLIQPFVNQLSTWYIRRSRSRFVKGEVEAFETLYYLLKNFILAVAPIIPFITESIYQNIKLDKDCQSVHLNDYPQVKKELIDKQLLKKMDLIQEIVNKGHAIRKKKEIKVRQPLASLTVFFEKKGLEKELTSLIKKELNVKKIKFKKGKKIKIVLDTKLTPQLKKEGKAREIIRLIQRARKKAGCHLNQSIVAYLPDWPKEYEEEIKKKTLVKEIKKGKTIKIVKE